MLSLVITVMLPVHLQLILVLSLIVPTSLGDTRELIPQDAPSNLTLLEIKDRQVLIEWDPIQPHTVRGNFKGYLVRTWNNARSQVYAFPPDVTKVNVEFFPFSKNFITVSARNEKYVGPPSEAISFDAPQIEPNQPYVLNIFTLSDKSIFIQWSKPTESNGILLGYKIYCSQMDETDIKVKEISHQINDPNKLQAKLTGLVEGVKYRIGVSALNCAGESSLNTAEIILQPHTPAPPFTPKFIYKINYTTINRDDICYTSSSTPVPIEDDKYKEEEFDYYDYLIMNDTKKTQNKITTTTSKPTILIGTEYDKRCLVDCMVLWIPDVKNNPGEYFYLKYKVKNEIEYKVTDPEKSEDFIIIQNFDACKNYEIVLVAVDGDYSTESGILLTPTKIF